MNFNESGSGHARHFAQRRHRFALRAGHQNAQFVVAVIVDGFDVHERAAGIFK